MGHHQLFLIKKTESWLNVSFHLSFISINYQKLQKPNFTLFSYILFPFFFFLFLSFLFIYLFIIIKTYFHTAWLDNICNLICHRHIKSIIIGSGFYFIFFLKKKCLFISHAFLTLFCCQFLFLNYSLTLVNKL